MSDPFKIGNFDGLDPVQSPTLDNCGFIAVISALAWSDQQYLSFNMPLYKIEDGDYSIRFFNTHLNDGAGDWENVIINQEIWVKLVVINKNKFPNKSPYVPLFASSREYRKVTWPCLLEKAYVKWRIGNSSIDNPNEVSYNVVLRYVNPRDVFLEFTGVDPFQFDIHKYSEKEIFEFIIGRCHQIELKDVFIPPMMKTPSEIKGKTIEKANRPMVIYTSPLGGSRLQSDFECLGLIPQHAYTILGCVRPNMIVLRDPRGDDCPRIWNPNGTYEIFENGQMNELNFMDDDGIFPIRVSELPKYFEDIYSI